jgi:capsule biosynthesis phosphatase
MKKNKLVVDLDNTITVDDKRLDYPLKPVNALIKETMDASNTKFDITIFTARNMRSFDGDLKKIHEHTKPIALKWLEENKIPYNDIIFGKPYCGEEGHYIDDKNISVEEFIFKFSGPFKNTSIDIVVPFYNEEGNILEVYKDLKKLERLFHVEKYIFVNNGSKDGSEVLFNELIHIEKKIDLIHINENKGLGNGIKEALRRSTADFILINHSDRQFDAYSYFLTHLDDLLKIQVPSSIFSLRKNRPLTDSIFTYFLRLSLSILSLKIIKEFNGQPKLIERKLITDIENLPNDYTIDFRIYKEVKPKYFFPIIEKPRHRGVSSWDKNIIGKWKVFLTYLSSCIK